MRYADNKVVTDFTKQATTDQSLKGIKTIAKKDLKYAQKICDEIIKNCKFQRLCRIRVVNFISHNLIPQFHRNIMPKSFFTQDVCTRMICDASYTDIRSELKKKKMKQMIEI